MSHEQTEALFALCDSDNKVSFWRERERMRENRENFVFQGYLTEKDLKKACPQLDDNVSLAFFRVRPSSRTFDSKPA